MKVAKMSNVEVERSIEAILMVVDEPVTEVVLAQVLEKSVVEIELALSVLSTSYDERGFSLKKINGGWRFYSLPMSRSLKNSSSMASNHVSPRRPWRHSQLLPIASQSLVPESQLSEGLTSKLS